MELKLSPKQAQAWQYLERPEIFEVFAGGGAGGGKSLLGCAWQIYRRTSFAGTRGFIGRENFTGLRDSTMKTYFGLISQMGFRSGVDYTYNAQEHIIYYTNGSEQHFRHMQYMPSDPDYDRFGSTEYTDGFVDETPEVDKRACQVLLSRMRYMHKDHDITPAVLYTGNPSDSWVKYDFVMDEQDEFIELPEHRARVLFTIMDNPDEQLRDSYMRTLDLLDEYDKQRLLYGDWTAQRIVDRPFAFSFKESQHVSTEAVYREGLPVKISIDFNREPFTCILAHIWADTNGQHCHIFQEIDVSNGSIEEMAKRILAIVPNKYAIELTGDAMGNNRNVKIKDSDNSTMFTALRDALGIVEKQIRVVRNPYHSESRESYNLLLSKHPDFKMHPTNCKKLIRDHKIVEVDEHGTIKKKDRKQVAQQADFIDCFVGDTLICTPLGDRQIKDISIGELVLTDNGYNRVIDTWSSEREVYEFTCENGAKFQCTKDHKFYVNNLGYLPIFDIFERKLKICHLTKSSITEPSTQNIQSKNITTVQKQLQSGNTQDVYIDRSGLIQTGKYLKVGRFTILMETLSIMTSTILKLLRKAHTSVTTRRKGLEKIQSLLKRFKQRELKRPQNGTEQMKGLNGTSNMQKTSALERKHTELSNVNNAEVIMRQKTQPVGFATTTVKAHGEGKTIPTWWSRIAKLVAKNIKRKNINQRSIAALNAGQFQIHEEQRIMTIERVGVRKVYDITVENRHNFYANGFLAHNCSRYLQNTFLYKYVQALRR